MSTTTNSIGDITRWFQVTLAPQPCSWWIWEPDAHRQTLHIDMSAYPDYTAQHKAMSMHDTNYALMRLELTNAASGGTAVFDWQTKSILSERYGVRHLFYSHKLNMEVAVYPDSRWIDELRMIMKLNPVGE